MAAPRRKNLLASRRRRRQDEGEEEESVLGELDDDSLSEGSAVSNDDDEAGDVGSESSGDDRGREAASASAPAPAQAGAASIPGKASQQQPATSPAAGLKTMTTQDGEVFPKNANSQGLGTKANESAPATEQLQFDELPASTDVEVTAAAAEAPKAPRNESAVQRARREHQDYIRERNANPAFVPTRGEFWGHDNRNSGSTALNSRTAGRGRGRGFGPAVNIGRIPVSDGPSNMPWTHDLHEVHETDTKVPSASFREKPVPAAQASTKVLSTATVVSTTPNRTFSFTTTLGNVKVHIALPGTQDPPRVSVVVKKNYILLPEHRPPLRRDKPVRVSVPDAVPRYIFPSADRSFIFIPRAMRPNQQPYSRGRGRGSFHQSRRPSIYGGYTPSVAMSRKSSIGGSTMRDGIISPTESITFRHVPLGADNSRPVVRMPSVGPVPTAPQPGLPILNGQFAMPTTAPMPPPASAMHGNHSTNIPMHQPRPQKTVSVAGIESPASLQVKAPQQQQEQPFHQQVPAHVANSYANDNPAAPAVQPPMPGMAGTTPLSQIPEGMVFAPAFQPYATMGQPAFFNAPYSNGAVFYPHMPDSTFGMPMPALAPSFVPGSQSHPINHMPPYVEASMGAGMMGPDNSMVYFYNPAMHPGEAQQQFPIMPNGPMMPMANGMSSQPPFFYPSMQAPMFYPTQSG